MSGDRCCWHPAGTRVRVRGVSQGTRMPKVSYPPPCLKGCISVLAPTPMYDVRGMRAGSERYLSFLFLGFFDASTPAAIPSLRPCFSRPRKFNIFFDLSENNFVVNLRFKFQDLYFITILKYVHLICNFSC